MVRPARKKLVIGVALFVAAVSLAFALHPIRDAICFPFLSPTEKSLVGKWQAQMIGGLNVTTIHADHTWSSVGGSCFGEDERPIVGRWRLDGSDVVFSFDSRQFSTGFHLDPRRESIRDLVDTDRRVRATASHPND